MNQSATNRALFLALKGQMFLQKYWAEGVTLFIILVLLLVGCGTVGYTPLVDTKNVDMSNYPTDLEECRQYAQQIAGPGENAAAGAVAGAVAGALLARLIGRDVNRGPAVRVGTVSGAASGAAKGYMDQKLVVRQCLIGRGYKVLQ